MGVFSLLCVCFLYGYGFLSGGKSSGREILHAYSVFSHFGELWLAWTHGGGIASGMSYIEIAVGQSRIGHRSMGIWNWGGGVT